MHGRSKRCWPAWLLVGALLGGAASPLAAVVEKTTDQFRGGDRARLRNEPAETASFKEGEVLVRFKQGIPLSGAGVLAAELAVDEIHEFRIMSQLRQSAFYLFRSARRSTRQLLADLQADPSVAAVSPNYRRRRQRLPNDPKFSRLWGMEKIAAADAWEKNTGSPGVVLAVLDTGVDYRHEDLAANMWRNPGEIANNGVDDDGNGYTDDLYGYDFAADNNGNQDSDPMDIESHGTHVAGTMAAVGNNGTGVCGVNWNVRIMALKGFRPDGYIYDSDSIEAIEYAVLMKRDYGVNVVAINASFGSSGSDSLQKDAIAEAGVQGIALVCAAGNDGTDNDASPFFPASYDLPNIIAVAASDNKDQLAVFSNFGASTVDIAAPGVGIFSTVPAGKGFDSRLISGGSVFETIPMEFAGLTPAAGLNRQLVDCDRGLDGSSFPPAVSGHIALIERGETTFAEKATRARNAGAVAAVIYNNEPGNFSGTLGAAGNWIPVVALSRQDGLVEKAKGNHLVNLALLLANYGFLDGTSMAAPHVCGALGLLAAQFPADDLAKRISRLYSGADRVLSLQGKIRAGARLNLARAVSQAVQLTLVVSRQQARVWVLKKDFAHVYFNVEKDPAAGISGEKYAVFRSRSGGSYQLVREVAAAELQNNAFSFYDKYLDLGVTYSYLIQVSNSQGEVIAISGEQSI